MGSSFHPDVTHTALPRTSYLEGGCSEEPPAAYVLSSGTLGGLGSNTENHVRLYNQLRSLPPPLAALAVGPARGPPRARSPLPGLGAWLRPGREVLCGHPDGTSPTRS